MARIHHSNIRSFGDFLANGIYTVHSRFNNAINFISYDTLVSIVTEEIGAGPLNIVVSGFDLNHIRLLTIDNESIILNGVKFDIDASKKIDSKIVYDHISIDKLNLSMKIFNTCLLENSPSQSLAFLIDGSRKQKFTTSFEKNFIIRFQSGVEEIFSPNYIWGIKKIRGLGFGFTPSSDDFICGFLYGLLISSQLYQIDYADCREQIYKCAIGKNPISNAFLLCAKYGLMFEKFKKLVFSILYQDEKAIIDNTERICAVGHTSGSDMGVGFFKAFSWQLPVSKFNYSSTVNW